MIITGSFGWVLKRAYAINDYGQITGFGDFQVQQHGFLLTPVALLIDRNDSGISLSWAALLEGYILQSTDDLSKPWKAASEDVVMAGRRKLVNVAMSERVVFYRLSKP